MTTTVTKTRTWPLTVVRIAVYLAGMGVGGFFGLLSTFLWSNPFAPQARIPFIDETGMILGGLGGVLAGHWWLKRMMVRRGDPVTWYLEQGATWGVVVGLADTALVHAGLAVVRLTAGGIPSGVEVLAIIPLASAFGFVAGLITGCFCGLLLWSVLPKDDDGVKA